LTNLPGQWLQCRANGSNVCRVLRRDPLLDAPTAQKPVWPEKPLRRRNVRNVQRFRGGLVFKAHRLLYHLTLGSRVTREKRQDWVQTWLLLCSTRPVSTLAATTHTDHGQPYTLHPAPCTLHPAPYTINLTQFTLHPTPCTLHPTPYTLHPTPYPLHPTPYTLRAKPCTLHHTPGLRWFGRVRQIYQRQACRSTSLITTPPLLGPYSRTIHMGIWWS